MNMRKIVVLGDNEAWGDLDKARVCEVPEKDVLNGPPSPEDYKKRSLLIERAQLQTAYLAGTSLEDILRAQRERFAELREAARIGLQAILEMNVDLRTIGRGRPEDGAHPDCPAVMLRIALSNLDEKGEPCLERSGR